jgi:hypothetical protein
MLSEGMHPGNAEIKQRPRTFVAAGPSRGQAPKFSKPRRFTKDN